MENNLPLHGVTLKRNKCHNACELQIEILKDDASYFKDKLQTCRQLSVQSNQTSNVIQSIQTRTSHNSEGKYC